MNKELTPLEALGIIAYGKQMENTDVYVVRETQNEAFRIVGDALKALEIIKDNKINGLELVWYNGMWFVFAPNCPRAIMYGTRKEEYDLLKEILL